MENNKATITASEDELIKMAEKIRQNKSENELYQKQLDKYFSGSMQSHEVINVCSTPNILKILGSKARKVVLNQKELENSISSSKFRNKNHTNGHEIDKSEIYKLSEAIRSPIAVLRGKMSNTNSVVLLTELVNNIGENVFVPISLDRQDGKISNISTLYGKKNLNEYLHKHSSEILAVNTKKADLLADTENQFLQSINDTVVRFDNSIAYTTANVKGNEQNFRKNNLNLSIDRNAEVLFDDNKINTVLFCDDDTLKTLAERTRVFEKTNATFKDMLNDDYTMLYVYADFHPNGEVKAWLSMQSDTYGWDYYDVPLKDSEKETLLYDLDDVAYAREDASAAQWLKEVEVVETEVKEEPDECVFEENQGGGRGR